MRVVLIGMGRMGQSIQRVLIERGHEVVATIQGSCGDSQMSLVDALDQSCPDVAIEFTTARSAPANVETILSAGVGVVSGTTGWDTQMVLRLAEDLTRIFHECEFVWLF